MTEESSSGNRDNGARLTPPGLTPKENQGIPSPRPPAEVPHPEDGDSDAGGETNMEQCVQDLREDNGSYSSPPRARGNARRLRLEAWQEELGRDNPTVERHVERRQTRAFFEQHKTPPEYNNQKRRLDSFRKASPFDLQFLKEITYEDGMLRCRGCKAFQEVHYRSCEKEQHSLRNDEIDDPTSRVFSRPVAQERRHVPEVEDEENEDEADSYEESGQEHPVEEEAGRDPPNRRKRHAYPKTVHELAWDGCHYTEDGYIKCYWCVKAAALKLEDCKCNRSVAELPMDADHGCDNPATNG